jgi:hypothetical protein
VLGAQQSAPKLGDDDFWDVVDSLPPISDSLAGFWYTDEGDYMILHLGVTETSPSDIVDSTVKAIWDLGIPDTQLAIEHKDYTTAELFKSYAAMETAAAKGAFGDSLVSFSLNAAANRIEVTPSESVSDLEALDVVSMAGTGVPLESLSLAEPMGGAIASSVFEYPPWKGGKRIRDTTSSHTGNCTMGFIVWNGGGSAWRAGTTAGHCTKNDADLYSGPTLNEYVGWGASNLFRGPTELANPIDATLVPLNHWEDATRRLYPQDRQITGLSPQASLQLGYPVCQFGQASGVMNCAGVKVSWPTSIYMSFTNINTGATNFKWVYSEFCWDNVGALGTVAGPSTTTGQTALHAPPASWRKFVFTTRMA